MQPGRRLRLHPDDLYALGAHRGGIDERWFSSTTNADNGPGTPPDEGLSYVRLDRAKRFQLKEAIDSAGDALLGADVMSRAGRLEPALQVLRQPGTDSAPHAPERCAREDGRPQGQAGGVLLPAAVQQQRQQLSRTRSWDSSPARQRTTCAVAWSAGTKATTASSITRRPTGCRPGTGWQIDAGILHAPGSLVTYEPQVNTDVFGMFQSLVEGRVVPWDLLVKDVPPENHHDLDFIIGMLDWDANVDPEFGKSNRVFPRPVRPFDGDRGGRLPRTVGLLRHRLVFGQGADGPAETQRHHHGRRRLRSDRGARRGHHRQHRVGAPTMIRFGEMTQDELFVTSDDRDRGRAHRERERQRSARHPQAFRPR